MDPPAALALVREIEDEQAAAKQRFDEAKRAHEDVYQRLWSDPQRNTKYAVLRQDCGREDTLFGLGTLLCPLLFTLVMGLFGDQLSGNVGAAILVIGFGLLATVVATVWCAANYLRMRRNRQRVLAAAAQGDKALVALNDLETEESFPFC